METNDFNKIRKAYNTNLFVIIIGATIAMIYNKLSLQSDSVTLALYAGIIGYFMCCLFNTLWLKRFLFKKERVKNIKLFKKLRGKNEKKY